MFEDVLQVVEQSPRIFSLGVFLTLSLLYYFSFPSKSKSLDVPSYDGNVTPYGVEFLSTIERASAEHPDSIFRLNTANYDTLVLPPKYIDEVKAAPEAKFSIGAELYTRNLGRYTLIGTVGRAHGFVNSIRQDLNRNLALTFPTLQAETEYAASTSIGDCPEWKPIAVYPVALRMVALLTGRVFIGPQLSRNEEWIGASIQTTVDTFSGSFKLWNYHWSIRPIMARLLPEIQNIHQQNKRVAELLEPVLSERLRQMGQPDFKPPADMLQFFLDNLDGKDAAYQAALQSAINVAAIHTTSMNITHVIYDLAAYSEHIEPLRAELEEVLSMNGGVWDKNSIIKLRKMDSFIRESQRMSPPGIVSMSRRVQQDVVLSDGVKLPKGTLVACDSWSATRDSNLWDNPEAFDGFRFEKLRAIPGNEAKYQFVTSSSTNMHFGHGSHACPGRFFVANEIKILMAHIIQNYDIALKPGCERPQSMYMNIMILPNMEAEVLFRSRR
ncbi:MAG: hypothetical protein Q9165_002320 [Trypethelium subeluteriae]